MHSERWAQIIRGLAGIVGCVLLLWLNRAIAADLPCEPPEEVARGQWAGVWNGSVTMHAERGSLDTKGSTTVNGTFDLMHFSPEKLGGALEGMALGTWNSESNVVAKFVEHPGIAGSGTITTEGKLSPKRIQLPDAPGSGSMFRWDAARTGTFTSHMEAARTVETSGKLSDSGTTPIFFNVTRGDCVTIGGTLDPRNLQNWVVIGMGPDATVHSWKGTFEIHHHAKDRYYDLQAKLEAAMKSADAQISRTGDVPKDIEAFGDQLRAAGSRAVELAKSEPEFQYCLLRTVVFWARPKVLDLARRETLYLANLCIRLASLPDATEYDALPPLKSQQVRAQLKDLNKEVDKAGALSLSVIATLEHLGFECPDVKEQLEFTKQLYIKALGIVNQKLLAYTAGAGMKRDEPRKP